MYTTKKAIGKYSNKLILSPIVGIFGIITFAINFDSNRGIFENIGNAIHSLVMVGLAISLYIIFNKKIKLVKGDYFEFKDNGFGYKSNNKKEFIETTDLKSIKKGIEYLEIKKINGEEIKIKLDDYFLEYEDTQKLGKEISELSKNFS